MFRNFFEKMFGSQDAEQVKMERELKQYVAENSLKDFVINLKEVNIKNTENKIEMSEELKMDEVETVEVSEEIQEEIVAVDNVEENTESIEAVNEDAPEGVSEETEVVENEEQPKVEEEGNEPPLEEPVEAPETEEVEEEGQEEPQPEEEQPSEEAVEEVEEKVEVEVPEVKAEDVVIEQPTDEVKISEATEKVELPENIVKPEIVDSVSDEKAELLKQIENLKAEKAERELEMAKMALSKEVEKEYSGVPGNIEDKVDMIYEIQNSKLSENAKQFILNSLKSLSAQNLEDCEEIGVQDEVIADENTQREEKVQNAIKEHGLTYNQAFLFVNGDRTLEQAKKASQKVRKQK